jgi:hypothetical protein
MILKDILGKIGLKMDNFTVCTPFFGVTISQNEDNKIASWQLYVELISRVATQPLYENSGDEEAALESIYKLFEITRDIIKQYGRKAETFSMLSLCLLNMVLRPFTSKWHKIFKNNLIKQEYFKTFRKELTELQIIISAFSGLLLEMSKVDKYEEIDFMEIEKFVNTYKIGFVNENNGQLLISN